MGRLVLSINSLVGQTGWHPCADHSTVRLTTTSQNEVYYTVTVIAVRDLAGNSLAPRIIENGVLDDPTRAQFYGVAPSGDELVDSDGDGLSDHEEQSGWTVTLTLLNGTTYEHGVTSDPFNEDTDGDGLSDSDEAALRLNPRDKDTDDDLLDDAFEEVVLFR